MIHVDTCILIYLMEQHAGRGADIERRMREAGVARLAISPLVRTECLVEPLRDGDVVLQRRYERALDRLRLLPFAPATLGLAVALVREE